ncbi:MAG: chemotaxis response regulator protein-glutamate methylesterase [Fibrobacteres bacterium]|nr:chemotaxis response regulator protein-glutamate methylesterase [Fibrobacterota bacterium]
MASSIRVLIVDDSAVVRSALSEKLSRYPGIEVVGTAMDPYMARDKILSLKPDVITLDIEMPRMDGLTFLEKLMSFYPLPVIVISSLAPEGSASYFKALELGALEVVAKPDSAFGSGIDRQIGQIADKIRQAAKTNMEARRKVAGIISRDVKPAHKQTSHAMLQTTDKIVAIAASTGGTQTFRAIAAKLPADAPPMVLVQHMPPFFTKSYAESLNSISAMEIKEAEEGDAVLQGRILVAPGNFHMQLRRSGARYYVELNQNPPVCHVRPSADVLFHSVAEFAGRNAVGVVLTGMGSDGASGLLAMKKAGASAIVQDEASCIVFGMPKAAYDIGACDSFTPLDRIPESIIEKAKST